MDLQHLLQRLETVIMESRRIPGTQMRMVDSARTFQLIDQMVIAIPEEIKRAQSIEQERDKIIAAAREEAERTRGQAHDDAAQLAENSSITAMAQTRAAAIEERARVEADRMRVDADNYAIATLKQLNDQLEHLAGVAANGVTKLETSRAALLERLNGIAETSASDGIG